VMEECPRQRLSICKGPAAGQRTSEEVGVAEAEGVKRTEGTGRSIGRAGPCGLQGGLGLGP
jgi:hypothetical protein